MRGAPTQATAVQCNPVASCLRLAFHLSALEPTRWACSRGRATRWPACCSGCVGRALLLRHGPYGAPQCFLLGSFLGAFKADALIARGQARRVRVRRVRRQAC